MKIVKRALKCIFACLLIFVVYFVSVIIWGMFTKYQPQDKEMIVTTGKSQLKITDTTKVFSILSWNIGYCGLGAEMDFFYDGGEKVRTSSFLVKKYSEGISTFINENDSVDFFLFQEVDENAKRSANINQIELISNTLDCFMISYGINYKSEFIPIPVLNPMGKVMSGILSASKYFCDSSYRYSYKSSYSWPKNLFMPNRCFIVNKYQLNDSNQLIVINTHNSAFDSEGKLKEVEMKLLSDYMQYEYKKGNYVIAGGDWNQNPPNFDLEKCSNKFLWHEVSPVDSQLFEPDWKFIFDEIYPTNRNVDEKWDISQTETTIIDFFIVSPNVKKLKVETLSQMFEFSDHEPILMQFVLN